jgi:hypothetical protein
VSADLNAAMQRRADERDQLERDLRQKYLTPGIPDAVAAKVFDKAWEDGHASGTHEVEIHYDDLSEIVNAAFKAGRKRERKHRLPGASAEYGFECEEFDENGSCIHSDHMQAAGL